MTHRSSRSIIKGWFIEAIKTTEIYYLMEYVICKHSVTDKNIMYVVSFITT